MGSMNRRALLRAVFVCSAALLAAVDGVMGQQQRETGDDGGLAATARILVRSDPTSVFAAFTDAGRMSQFWFTRRDSGLVPGESVRWFLGSGADAASFKVDVIEVVAPERIVIDWADFDGTRTRVTWTMEGTADGDTLLTVTETGFAGTRDEIVAKALNSTGGFNQVILAAKALIEHGVSINVVADHP